MVVLPSQSNHIASTCNGLLDLLETQFKFFQKHHASHTKLYTIYICVFRITNKRVNELARQCFIECDSRIVKRSTLNAIAFLYSFLSAHIEYLRICFVPIAIVAQLKKKKKKTNKKSTRINVVHCVYYTLYSICFACVRLCAIRTK